ncbi:MAG: tripartite tricarboxylate transporter substrate binding protein, partial [Sedimentibacter sp.]
MKRKRSLMWCLIVISLLTTLLLVGCNGGESTSTVTPSETPATTAPEVAKTDYPKDPITLIVPFAAGGGTDTGARLLSAEAEKILGQPIVIVNKPGASGWLGYTDLLAAESDGYTIAQFNDLNVIGGYLDKQQKRENSLDDFAPIICYVIDSTAISININETRFTTFEELVEYAKTNEVTTTIAGNAGLIAMSKLNDILGTKFIPVRNQGAAESLPAVMGGHVDVLLNSVGEAKVPAQGGQIKPIAVMSEERNEYLPDVPTVNEAMGVEGATNASVRGLAAPAGVDQAVLDILIDAFSKAAISDTFKSKMAEQGLTCVSIIG